MRIDREKIRNEIQSAIGNRPYILRQDALRQSLDGLSPAVMSNFDCRGLGPAERLYVGRKCGYPTDAYIEWLVSRISDTRPADR